MSANEPRPWNPVARVAYRFLFCYLVLFFFPFPSGLVNPGWLGSLFDPFWSRAVPWFASTFLGKEVAYNPNGSGDTSFDFARLVLMVVIATVATLVWSVLDHRRTDYRTLNSWSRVWLRYALLLCMLTFGAVKVVMLQFEAPGVGRLAQPLGEFSPMALLWTFMGSSPLYSSFTGVTEVFATLLLLFRRTTTLGALLVAMIMTNVLMLNLSYDVPVKLGAMHVLLLALVLLGPDFKRLIDFFVLNRATVPADLGPVVSSPVLHRLSTVAKCAFIVTLVGYFVWDSNRAYKDQLSHFPPDPVRPYGRYEVVSMEVDGNPVEKLAFDDFQWQVVNISDGAISIRSFDGQVHKFRISQQPLPGSFTLFEIDNAGERRDGFHPIGGLQFENGGRALKGRLLGHDLLIGLKPKNKEDFNLTNRGFRWVSEEPFFR
jgi:hypothetical protein